MEWQPIETAPKKGEAILVAFGYGFNAPCPLVVRWDGDEWALPDTDAIRLTFLPTHWMPLPPPPNKKAPDR